MVNLLLLIAHLGYGIPAYDAIHCDSLITDWLANVDHVEIWYAPRYGSWRLMRTKDVRGRGGDHDTLMVPDDSLASVFLVAVDDRGARSCESNPVTVAGRVGVPPPAPRAPIRWYDIAGRRIPEPTVPGVYWQRVGDRPRKIVLTAASLRRSIVAPAGQPAP